MDAMGLAVAPIRNTLLKTPGDSFPTRQRFLTQNLKEHVTVPSRSSTQGIRSGIIIRSAKSTSQREAPFSQISKATVDWGCTEEKLKNMIAEHGAVDIGVEVDTEFQNYGGGIFDKCVATNALGGHAVLVGLIKYTAIRCRLALGQIF